MKYLCLIYHDGKKFDDLTEAEFTEIEKETREIDEELTRSGHLLASAALESSTMTTTVKVRNGKTIVTGGPFAEAKEEMVGIFLLEARDLNEAIRLASKLPQARIGIIEVRPVVEH